MSDKITHTASDLFHKICGRGPTKSEIKLFDNLKSPSNYNNTTSVSVSTKYRHVICENNPNATEFEKTYQQLHKANLKELDPLVSLIYSIKKSPDVVEMLRQTCVLDNSNSIKQSNSNTERVTISKQNPIISALIKTDIPSTVSSLSSYSFMTSDFVDTNAFILPADNTPPLSSLDIQSQEKAIIKDMIYCLMGDHGVYVKALPLTANHERQFEIDKSMYPGYLDLVKSILNVASQMSTIYRFCDEHQKYEYGSVNQALVGAIKAQVKDFQLIVCQVEEIASRTTLTLKGMLNYISEPGHLMRCIANICQDIAKYRSRGGAVLSMFYHHGLSAGDQKQSSLINHLMKASTVPMFRMLKIWIYRGIISDPYQEFFIKENGGRPTESNISGTYWTNTYTIENNLVPRFLEVYVQKILHTGKYLNVIQLCDGDAAFPDVEDMEYESDEQHFILQIDRAYQYASKLLLNIMFRDKKLMDYLMIMKHFFLLDQADWLSHFMFSASDELNEKFADCQRNRLESLLEVAIQASGNGHEPLRENITVDLTNQELIPFLYNIMEFDFQNLPNAKRTLSQNITGQNLSVLEAFSLKIKVEWPISLVLNNSAIQRYQLLFRYLFYCHHVERVLFGVWSLNKSSSTGHFGNFYLINKASILGNNMRTFIQHLIYYMTTEVIEPFWITFKAKLDQAQNLDEVLIYHDEFLQSSIMNCIGTTNMLKDLQKIMVLCVNFANRLNRLRSYNQTKKDDSFEFHRQTDTEDIAAIYDSESFESIIKQDEATFTEIARHMIADIKKGKANKMLLKLVDRLEFNGFYDDNGAGSDVDD